MNDNEELIEIYTAACAILEEEGHEASVREDYSGRCMYGETTPAIVTDAEGSEMAAAVFFAALKHTQGDSVDLNQRGLFEDIKSFIPGRFDTMGRNNSVYY